MGKLNLQTKKHSNNKSQNGFKMISGFKEL